MNYRIVNRNHESRPYALHDSTGPMYYYAKEEDAEVELGRRDPVALTVYRARQVQIPEEVKRALGRFLSTSEEFSSKKDMCESAVKVALSALESVTR